MFTAFQLEMCKKHTSPESIEYNLIITLRNNRHSSPNDNKKTPPRIFSNHRKTPIIKLQSDSMTECYKQLHAMLFWQFETYIYRWVVVFVYVFIACTYTSRKLMSMCGWAVEWEKTAQQCSRVIRVGRESIVCENKNIETLVERIARKQN